jgi:hypothetical protein
MITRLQDYKMCTCSVRGGSVVPSRATRALVLRHISGRTAAASASVSSACQEENHFESS